MKHLIYTAALASALLLSSCEDFLDCPPSAVLSEDNTKGVEAVEGLVNSAYASLVNGAWGGSPSSLFFYCSVRSDDSYKGGSGTNDQIEGWRLETSEGILVSAGFYNSMWTKMYNAISRCNSALKELNGLADGEFSEKNARIGEMKFLRAYFYYTLKVLYNAIPWIDDTMSPDDVLTASNVQYSSDELWAKIYQDCVDAFGALPEKQAEVGRPTKYAAAAAAAKMALYRAYGQDAQWQFTSIDKNRMSEVLKWTEEALKGPYTLNTDFGTNFYPEGENSPESIWAIQYSHEDGTMKGRGNFGNGLNWPVGIGGCDFHKPSQNLVNAFKTEDGLPMLEDFNKTDYDYKNPTAFEVDPRLYHTVAMPGIAFKLKYDESQPNNNIFQENWNRTPSTYGYYATLKEVLPVNDPHMISVPPFLACSLNQDIYRLDDVMLMRAEALVETGSWPEARALVNALRNRAKTSTTYFKPETAVPDNYNVREYTEAEWSSESLARKAVRFERRLELAMESSRFFDLVRWGIAADVLNSYFKEETPHAPYLENAKFDKGDEYVPIPNNQMVLSKGLYEQNWSYK